MKKKNNHFKLSAVDKFNMKLIKILSDLEHKPFLEKKQVKQLLREINELLYKVSDDMDLDSLTQLSNKVNELKARGYDI